jgi:hypothetical protein
MEEKGNAYRDFVGKPERDHREDPGANGRKKIKMIIKGKEKWGDSVEWVDLARGRDKVRAVMNTIRNLRPA